MHLVTAPQVLLGKDGKATVWMCTSKEGDVAPRKAATDSSVIETFKRQSLSHANNVNKFCAVAYYTDGSHRTLDEDAFGAFMSNFSAGVKDCQAVQVSPRRRLAVKELEQASPISPITFVY